MTKHKYRVKEIIPNKPRRYGKIVVSERFNELFWKNLKGKVVPYKIEYHFIDRSFHIECECKHFRLINEGGLIPTYNIIVNQTAIPLKKKDKEGNILFRYKYNIEGVEEIK